MMRITYQKDNSVTDGPRMSIVLHIRWHPKNGIRKKVNPGHSLRTTRGISSIVDGGTSAFGKFPGFFYRFFIFCF